MTDVASVLAELHSLEDPRSRAVNERHGDDHGVNLSKLRGVAKALKTQHPLALELWETDDTAARLVALLIAKPKEFSADELDTMLREARAPKVMDWLINYIVKKSPHMDELRERWFIDPEDAVAAAGWSLTTERLNKRPDGINAEALLDEVETDMVAAPARKQWSMNETLATVGITRPDLRTRAIDIGERLEVLKDYPTPRGCTSPFAPIWIAEIVRRNEGVA